SLFSDRHPVVIDMGGAVAQRSMPKPKLSKELSAMSAELESRRRKMEREDHRLTVEEARIRLRMRELAMRESSVEARSLPVEFLRDPYGNAIDWHPGHQ
ncbi:MAG: hypothetical protein JWP83_1240, partial [Mycobacterium sp.]|uniref:hypothetical protein n=1 Tax=Mycobacterium sp. TaxID=1785 RepID=UPI002639EA13